MTSRSVLRSVRERGRGRVLLASLWCAWAMLSSPSPAAAQRHVFVEGLSRLTAALPGPYGDEGALIVAAIEQMSRGLAEWDRTIGALEARVAADAPDAAAADGGVRLRLALAGMYIERSRLADALRQIGAVIRLDPDRADLHLQRALVLDAMGEPGEAARAFRVAWDLDRTDPIKAYYVLQRGASSSDHAAEAREVLSRAYARLVQNGGPGNAAPFARVALLDDAAGDQPAIPHAAYADGYVLVAQGAYEQAVAQFRRAAAIDPLVTDPAVRTASMPQASAAFKAGRLADARVHLESALAVAPASSEARRILGLVYWAGAQNDMSIAHLEQAVRVNPGDERARVAMARVLTDAGRVDEAERALLDAVRAIPESALARWWLAWGHDDRNQIPNARRELTRVNTPAVLSGRGRMYASIGRLSRTEGDFAGAVDAFARHVRLAPNDAAAHLELAYAYRDQDRLDEAFAELVAALLINPDAARAHAEIGRIQLARGSPAEAETALRRALALTPGDYEARYGLAMALTQLGRGDEAARELAAFRKAQQQAIADRRANIARDVAEEAARARKEIGR